MNPPLTPTPFWAPKNANFGPIFFRGTVKALGKHMNPSEQICHQRKKIAKVQSEKAKKRLKNALKRPMRLLCTCIKAP